MRQFSILVILISSILLLCVCCTPVQVKTETTSTPGVDINNEASPLAAPSQQPSLSPSEEIPIAYAVSIIKDDTDIDGDGVMDSVHAYSTDLFEPPFYVDITLSTKEKPYHVSVDTDCLDSGNKLYIVDITGDSIPDIVFPNLGGTDTRGTISPLVLTLKEDGVEQSAVFGAGFFQKDSLTFVCSPINGDHTVGNNLYTLECKASGNKYAIDLHEGLSALGSVDSEDYTEILFDYATFSGDVVAVENGRYGIEIVSVINATTSNLNTGDGTTLETYYLYSVLEYEDGGWKVGDERLS